MASRDTIDDSLEPPSVPSSDIRDTEVDDSRPPTETSTPTRKTDQLVVGPNYRRHHLRPNKIRLTVEDEDGPAPACVLRTWEEIQQLPGEKSPPPARRDFLRLRKYRCMGVGESTILDFLCATVLLGGYALERLLGNGDVLRSQRVAFFKEAVPGAIQPNTTRVSRPWPDVAYGYMEEAITDLQSDELAAMSPIYGRVSKELWFPFLVIESKGSDGNMAVAQSQCVGGTAACVNAIRGLNSLAEEHGVDPLDSIAFGIVLNEAVADVQVTWWQADGEYFRQQSIAPFAFVTEDGVRDFKEALVKILQWGKDVRLKAISATIDKITEARSEKENAPKKRAIDKITEVKSEKENAPKRRGRPPKKGGDNKRAKTNA